MNKILTKEYILNNCHKIFLIISTIFGLLYCFLIPPIGLNDEDRHFLRVYSYAYGEVYDDVLLPMKLFTFVSGHNERQFSGEIKKYDANTESFFKDIFEKRKLDIQLIKIKKNRADVYHPVVYWPAIIAVYISEKFELSYPLTLYLSRLSILIASTIIIFFAIKTTPVFKIQFLLISLIPSFIVNRSGVNADGLTYAYILYFLSLILKFYNQPIGNASNIKLFVTAVLVGLSKTVYAPILLLVFLLKIFKIGDIKGKLKLLLFIVLIPLALSYAWGASISEKFSKKVIQFDMDYETGLGIGYAQKENNPKQQLDNSISSPLLALSKLGLSLPLTVLEYITSFTQTIIYNRVNTNFMLGIICFWLLFMNNNQKLFSANEVKLIHLVNLSLFCITMLVIYFTWSKPDDIIITGVQARYFTINTLLLMLTIKNKATDEQTNNTNLISIFMFITLNISGVMSVIEECYR